MKKSTWLSGVFKSRKRQALSADDAPPEKLVRTEDRAKLISGSKSLLTLPMELFVKVLEYTAQGQSPAGITRDLYSLSCTCKQLDSVLRDLRSERVLISRKTQAQAFYKYYSKKADAARRVRSVIFVHPVRNFQASTSHHGHGMESPTFQEKSWGYYILSIIQILPCIECVELRELSPNFYFDDIDIRAVTYKKRSSSLSVPNLIINPESGWRVLLLPTVLAPFSSIENLYLCGMVVDNLLLSLPVTNLSLSHCQLQLTQVALSPNPPTLSPRRSISGSIPLASKLQTIYMDATTLAQSKLERGLLSVPSVVVGMIDFSQLCDVSILSQIMLSIFGPSELVEGLMFSTDLGCNRELLRLYLPAKVDCSLSYQQLDNLSPKEITIILPADDLDKAIGLIDKCLRRTVTAGLKAVTLIGDDESGELHLPTTPQLSSPIFSQLRLTVTDRLGCVLLDHNPFAN